MSAWLDLDRASLLVRVVATTRLDALEPALAREGLTLDVRSIEPGTTVGDWLARGAPGARDPWLDPADHLVAGYTGTIGKRRVTLAPAPRRATGPDLFALLHGHRGRFGALEEVWLRVHRADVERPSTMAFRRADPPLDPSESRLLDALARELRG